MLAYRYPLIAREGWLWIAIVVVAAFLVQIRFGLPAAPLWLLAGVMLYLFRDPPRQVPSSPLAVVSPVDGSVRLVETAHDPYLAREAVRIVIRMAITSVYSVRSPMEGKVVEQWLYGPGKSAQELRYAQWIQSDEGDDVLLAIVPGTALSRPRCYAHSGERLGQGQRCGFIRFGALVEVWLPPGSRIEVAEGDRLHAGSDIIATLVHERAATPKVPLDTVAASDDS